MPQMGYDMQEGTVVRWLKDEGSPVETGEAIAEIETDKAVVEFESTADGLLRRILVPEGTNVPVGQAIAIVGTEDEDIPEIAAPEPTPAPEPEQPTDGDASIPLPPAPQAEDVPAPVGQEIRASPVARRLADEKGVDLSQVKGTGPGNRITKEDVLSYAADHPTPDGESAPPPKAAAAPTPEFAPGEKVPLTRMRQQIARVTSRSKQEIPHYYVSSDVDMTQAMEVRRQVNQSLGEQDARVTVNDMVIKACVGALKTYPKFNASFANDAVQMNETINVGVAIAEEEGLIVPAIMDCGNKSLVEVARASKDLIERAKSGTLRPQEYTGGTFSISNMGMFDVSSFMAIILPPQSAMLAIGTVTKTPVVRNDQVAVADIMTATLSVDHRVSDGAEGARFLVEVKRFLENPASLLL